MWVKSLVYCAQCRTHTHTRFQLQCCGPKSNLKTKWLMIKAILIFLRKNNYVLYYWWRLFLCVSLSLTLLPSSIPWYWRIVFTLFTRSSVMLTQTVDLGGAVQQWRVNENYFFSNWFSGRLSVCGFWFFKLLMVCGPLTFGDLWNWCMLSAWSNQHYTQKLESFQRAVIKQIVA